MSGLSQVPAHSAPAEVACAFCDARAFTPEQVIERGRYFYICVPLGQVVPGHVIVAAQRCDLGLRALSYCSTEQMAELLSMEHLVEQFYRRALGADEVTFYEQGRAGGGAVRDPSGGFPHHAHYCALPVCVDARSYLERELGFGRLPAEAGVATLMLRPPDGPYLFVGTIRGGDGSAFVYTGRSEQSRRCLESMRFKEVVAGLLGVPWKGRWREWLGESDVAETAQRLRRFLAQGSGRE